MTVERKVQLPLKVQEYESDNDTTYFYLMDRENDSHIDCPRFLEIIGLDQECDGELDIDRTRRNVNALAALANLAGEAKDLLEGSANRIGAEADLQRERGHDDLSAMIQAFVDRIDDWLARFSAIAVTADVSTKGEPQ